ncbi:glycerophosphodiester phosphodiesterase, partial [Clostridium perfringens]
MKRIAAVLLLFSAIMILLQTHLEMDEEEPQGFAAYRLIAHAMG